MAFNVTSVGVGRRNRFFFCMCSRNCIIIFVIVNVIAYLAVVAMCQSHPVILIFLGCCWYSVAASQIPNCWSSCNARRYGG